MTEDGKSAATEALPHDGLTTRESLLRDLVHYVGLVQEIHADPYRVVSESEFNDVVADEKRRLTDSDQDRYTVVECYYSLQRIAALMQDGHTRVVMPAHVFSESDWAFPLALHIIDGRLYVAETPKRSLLPSYAEILEINGVPSGPLISRAEELCGSSLSFGRHQILETRLQYYLSGYLRLRPPWTVKYRLDDQTGTASVGGVPAKRYARRVAGRIRPSHFQYGESELTVGDTTVPIVRIPSFSFGQEADYQRFIDRFFKKHHDAHSIVIDLRDNEGGSGYWGYYLLGHLASEPFVHTKRFEFKVSNALRTSQYAPKAGPALADARNGERLVAMLDEAYAPHADRSRFRGQVYLLISRRTFSAGAVAAAIFKAAGLGITVGQETMGRGQLCSDAVTVALPNTRLEVSIPTAVYTLPGHSPDRGVVPDVHVEWTIEDYRSGRDPDLEKVRELIRGAGAVGQDRR